MVFFVRTLGNKIAEIGVLKWDETYTYFINSEDPNNSFIKVVVPIESTHQAQGVEVLLVLFKFANGIWKVNLWDEAYFRILRAVTDHEVNRLAYENILSEFEKVRTRRDDPDSGGLREYPTSGYFIEFADGTLIYVDYEAGAITLVSGLGLSGCFGGEGWEGTATSMTDMSGNEWNLGNDGNEWNSGEYGGFENSWSGDSDFSTIFNTNNSNSGNSSFGSGESDNLSGINYTLPLCENPAFWNSMSPPIYHDFILGIASVIEEYDLPVQNNVPENASDYCAACYSLSDIYCAAINSGCFELVNGSISQAILEDCLVPALHTTTPPPINPPDQPQTFAQIVLANPSAENLVQQLQLFDTELELEYQNYLESNLDLLDNFLGFIHSHPNYESDTYRQVIGEILQFIAETGFEADAKTSALVISRLLQQLGTEHLDEVTTFEFYQATNLYLAPNIANPDFATYCGIEYYLYGQTYPEWSSIKKRLWSFYSSISEGLHLALDFIGLVPVGGEIADLTNGILYTLEGDGINATLSFAAMIPVAGWASTGAKFAFKLVGGSGREITLTFKLLANGLIDFGDRRVLARLIKPAANQNAHHIIPWGKCNHPVVQAAADVGWHPNHSDNGINMLKTLHVNPGGSFDAHPAYDAMIESRLTDWANAQSALGGYTSLDAFNQLNTIISQVRAAIAASPTTHINNITIP